MPLWLTYNKNLILNYSHTWLQNSIETSELQHGLYGTRLYAARKKNQTLWTNKHNGKITNPERYDEISTRCHEDLLQSTPVLVAADWNPTELSKEHLETLMVWFTWSEEGKDPCNQKHVPVEETPSLLLGGELRIHHVYLCHLQLMSCKNSLLVACWHCLTRQVEMGPWALAAKKFKINKKIAS